MIEIQIVLLIIECTLITFTGVLSYLMYKLVKATLDDVEKKKKNSLF